MPKFTFIPQNPNQENQKQKHKIVGLENFTIMNPYIDGGAGRARQIIFASTNFLDHLTSSTYYAASEAKLKEYFSHREAIILINERKIVEAMSAIFKDQTLDEISKPAKLKPLIEALTQNLERLSKSLPKTIFDDKDAFRAGVLESRAFILKQLKINYGVEWLQWEIIAAKFAGLTGIIAPNTLIAVNSQDETSTHRTIDELKEKVISESSQSLQIASQRLRGYHDLSSFLLKVVNQYPQELLAAENIEKYYQLREKILEIQNQEKETDSKTADSKQEKANLYLEIYQLLPTELKDQINELRVVSSWIGNWDMFNWDLDNCGFCIRHNRNGTVSIEPAMVDFGNSLFNGFGGIYKHLSGDSVNKAAKSSETKPQDFDPEIPEPDRVIEKLIGFEKQGAVDLLLGRFPRRLPFQGLFQTENQQLIKFLSDSKNFDIDKISQGTLRGLYRISLVSNQAIEKMVRKWYIFEGEDFLSGTKKNTEDQTLRKQLSPDYLIELMIDRRDDFVEKFKPLIRRYEKVYEQDAIATKYEVEAAAIDISLTKPKSFTSETFASQLCSKSELTI